jgi:hypothetical protein
MKIIYSFSVAQGGERNGHQFILSQQLRHDFFISATSHITPVNGKTLAEMINTCI